MKLLLLAVLLVACESDYAKKCRANGGEIAHVNCVLTPITVVDGSGNISFTWIETCDEKCFGARPEAK